MTTTISFGAADSCEIALGEHTRLAPDAAGHPAVDDPAAVMRAALTAPCGFPPLAAALAPGDRVAVAVGKGLPSLASLLRGAINALVDAGAEPANITVVLAEPFDQQMELGAELGVQFAVHNPDDATGVAMIGMTRDGRPVRFNRAVAEADFVLPIAAARLALGGEGAPAKFAGLFPQFSSREAADRFHGRGTSTLALRRTVRVAESDEAGWLLGILLSVGIVPGAGGGVAAVVAGDPAVVAKIATEQFQTIWERPAIQQGDLVIAAVTGDAEQQTWTNVARAISAAERVVRPDGAIAVCCDLEEPPGEAFERLRDAVDFGEVAQRLRRDPAADARPAMILAQALERGPVYLRSRLPADVVESLGMTPIETAAELSRLAAGRRHCVVIEEAQRLRPRLVAGSE
jgi:nickel-dependent lactate racemase